MEVDINLEEMMAGTATYYLLNGEVVVRLVPFRSGSKGTWLGRPNNHGEVGRMQELPPSLVAALEKFMEENGYDNT